MYRTLCGQDSRTDKAALCKGPISLQRAAAASVIQQQQQQHALYANNSKWHPETSGQQCKRAVCAAAQLTQLSVVVSLLAAVIPCLSLYVLSRGPGLSC
jgi:hypothetical protein